MSQTQSLPMDDFSVGSGFAFSGATITGLDASEYTLVTIALDETGSIAGKEDEIRAMLVTAIDACGSSAYSQNLLVRVIRFGSQYARDGAAGIDEIHGFKSLAEIDTAAYPQLRGGGMTPLCDALYSSVGAMNTYAQELTDMDFSVNGITFVITDGGENSSVATVSMVKGELQKSVQGEVMESHLSILIGIDTGYGDVQDILQEFKDQTDIGQFIWAGDATKNKLAKLAEFVSNSISSTSQALGTGGVSQQISATI